MTNNKQANCYGLLHHGGNMTLMTFQSALELAGDSIKTVLLGNGFGMAYSPDSFRYFVFFEMLRQDPSCEKLVNVFEQLGTSDFEKVMSALNSSVSIAAVYGCDCEELSLIRADEDKLKTKLISFISDKHPAKCTDIEDSKYTATRSFLHNFSSFFTTNYDFLLYWALMRNQCGLDVACDDGFRGPPTAELTWGERSEQNVFYLHGALHIYKMGNNVIKLRSNDERSLREQVDARISNEQFPVYVSGRDSEEKVQKIDEDKYLRNCFKKLKEVSGSLFVHGHSIDSSDSHIWDAIAGNNHIRTVYVSLFGDEKSAENQSKKQRAMSMSSRDRQILFYSAESTNLWTAPLAEG